MVNVIQIQKIHTHMHLSQAIFLSFSLALHAVLRKCLFCLSVSKFELVVIQWVKMSAVDHVPLDIQINFSANQHHSFTYSSFTLSQSMNKGAADLTHQY